MSEIIKVEHLRYVYNAGMPDETAALDDVSFSIEKGDFVGVMGSTGSGKSTLIAHFNGLNRPTSGKGGGRKPAGFPLPCGAGHAVPGIPAV